MGVNAWRWAAFRQEESLGLELGLIGFVFCASAKPFIFIIPCQYFIYVHFWPFCNWVCIGFELGLFGFELGLFGFVFLTFDFVEIIITPFNSFS